MTATAFLHCALASSAYWRPVARAAGIDAPILIDLIGHGRAPDWDAGRDYQTEARDHALGRLPATPAHLVGHSYGACVALRVALDRPDRVARLTLIEPVFFAAALETPEFAAYCLDFAPTVAAWEAGRWEEAADHFSSYWGDETGLMGQPESLRRYAIDRMPLVRAGWPAIGEDNAAQLAPGRIEALSVPVTLLTGTRSPAVIGAIAERLCARMPRARRVAIDGAGHLVPRTHPAEVAAQL